jgi:hypothetical protein
MVESCCGVGVELVWFWCIDGGVSWRFVGCVVGSWDFGVEWYWDVVVVVLCRYDFCMVLYLLLRRYGVVF